VTGVESAGLPNPSIDESGKHPASAKRVLRDERGRGAFGSLESEARPSDRQNELSQFAKLPMVTRVRVGSLSWGSAASAAPLENEPSVGPDSRVRPPGSNPRDRNLWAVPVGRVALHKPAGGVGRTMRSFGEADSDLAEGTRAQCELVVDPHCLAYVIQIRESPRD